VKNSTRRTTWQILISSGLVVVLHLPLLWWLEVLEEVEPHKLKLVFTSFALKHRLARFASFNARGIIIFTLRYIAPFVLMVYFNIRIILVLRKLSAIRNTLSACEVKSIGVTKVVIAIVSVSTMTNMFFFAFVASIQTSGTEESAGYFGLVYSLGLLLNSSINFVFYCAFGEKFRRECQRTLNSLVYMLKRKKALIDSTTVTQSSSQNCTNNIS